MYEFLSRLTEDINSFRTIQGKEFTDFLDMCFQRSTYFSLTKATWARSIDDSAKKELEPFLIRELKTLKWYGYDYSKLPKGFPKRVMEVNIYHARHEAKSIIEKYFSDIFLNEKKGDVLVESNQTVEDLCFFSKNLLWLGTVSHEIILDVYLPDEVVKSSLLSYGPWVYEDVKNKIINLESFMKL